MNKLINTRCPRISGGTKKDQKAIDMRNTEINQLTKIVERLTKENRMLKEELRVKL